MTGGTHSQSPCLREGQRSGVFPTPDWGQTSAEFRVWPSFCLCPVPPPSLFHRFHLTVFPKALAQKSPSQALRLGNLTSDRVKEGRPNSQLCCLHDNSAKHPSFPFPARPTGPFLSRPHLRDHLQEHPNCI